MSTNKIQHKRSSTENNPPSSLDAGEIAINTNATTPHIHFEDAGGDMRSVGADPTATGDYVRRVTASGTANTWVATNSVPGTGDGSGDFGFWNRDDTTNTLEPRQANDNLDIGSGGLSADNGTFTGRIRVGTDLIFDKLGTADVTISAATPGDARTYTFPAQAGDRNITLDPAAPASTTQYVRQITDTGVGTWVAATDSASNTKYSLNNDDTNLTGVGTNGTTNAINSALVAGNFIADSGDLNISDLVEVVDTGNANANADVIPGHYIWDGTDWIINNFWIRTQDAWGTVLQPSVVTDGLNVQGRIRFTGRNGNHIVSTDNPPPASTKAENDGVWLLTNTVYGIGNSNEGGVFGNSATGTNWKTCITFKTGEGQACGEIQAKKQVEPRFAANSDRRLKSNIVDAESMLDKFEQLQVRRFTIASPNPEETPADNVLGFIADELQQVFPEAVEGEPGATKTVGNVLDADGVIVDYGIEDPATSGYKLEEGHIFASTRSEVSKYQTVASSALIIPMAKAVQELIAINKDQAARIEALEAGSVASLEERVRVLETADTIDNAGDAGTLALIAELMTRVSELEAGDTTDGI